MMQHSVEKSIQIAKSNSMTKSTTKRTKSTTDSSLVENDVSTKPKRKYTKKSAHEIIDSIHKDVEETVVKKAEQIGEILVEKHGFHTEDFVDPEKGREASVAYAITTYMKGYEWLAKAVTVAILAGFSSVILVMLMGLLELALLLLMLHRLHIRIRIRLQVR
mgnify:CR=1 FL=1